MGEQRAERAPGPRSLILLRHGRTAWNHAGRVQGQLEVDLDEIGREQAERVAEASTKASVIASCSLTSKAMIFWASLSPAARAAACTSSRAWSVAVIRSLPWGRGGAW